jgi:hypothetical protein
MTSLDFVVFSSLTNFPISLRCYLGKSMSILRYPHRHRLFLNPPFTIISVYGPGHFRLGACQPKSIGRVHPNVMPFPSPTMAHSPQNAGIPPGGQQQQRHAPVPMGQLAPSPRISSVDRDGMLPPNAPQDMNNPVSGQQGQPSRHHFNNNINNNNQADREH